MKYAICFLLVFCGPGPILALPAATEVSQAVLLEGEGRSVCVTDLVGRENLVPDFLKTSAHASPRTPDLPPCDEEQLAKIKSVAASFNRNVHEAAVPLAVVAICFVSGVAGGAAYDYPLLPEYPGTVASGIGAAVGGLGAGMMMTANFGRAASVMLVAAGATVGTICAVAGVGVAYAFYKFQN